MAKKAQPRKELGRGWAFPIRLVRGSFAMSEGPQDIQEAIRIILGTRVGERVMRDQFGSLVPELLFEAITPRTAGRLVDAIRSALLEWEPRIEVLDVSVSPDAEVPTRLIASLSYRIKEHNSLFNQVFPFYLREGVEEA